MQAALVDEGVPAGSIVTIGRGQEDLLVPTADGVREPENRRVEIMVPQPPPRSGAGGRGDGPAAAADAA